MILCAVFSLSVIASGTNVFAEDAKKTSVEYIENAKLLLKQVSVEYKNGNYQNADELATSAYLDNIEYVEVDMNGNGRSDMVSDIDDMMVDDLRGMIRNRVAQDELDSEITLIDAKLSEAMTVVPEFPLMAVSVVMGSLIASIVLLGRISDVKIF